MLRLWQKITHSSSQLKFLFHPNYFEKYSVSLNNRTHLVSDRHRQYNSQSGQITGTRTRSLWGLLFAVGLFAKSNLTNNDNDAEDSNENFFLTAHCATVDKRQFSKDREAAIKSLDVVADVAQEVQPAVVSITSADKGFLLRQPRSTGSGFLIDNNGHVITNAHVVGYRNDVFVHMSDGSSFPGQVLAVDVSSDLALIRLDVDRKVASLLPFIPLASNLKANRPGHFVLALGSPLMLANSVTVGVVSAVDRDLGHSEGLKYIQTDAIITFGNSGGPLVNLYGEVIGVNTMVAGTGVGFAIPVDQVRKFFDLALSATSKNMPQNTVPKKSPILSTDPYMMTPGSSKSQGGRGHRRYLGLVMRTLTPELAFELASRGDSQFTELTDGVFIHAVLQNSPAQKAGLKPGDIIIAVDGLPITNARQFHATTENRDQFSITLIRRGQRMNIDNIRTEAV